MVYPIALRLSRLTVKTKAKLPTAMAFVPRKNGTYQPVPMPEWLLATPMGVRIPLILLMAWALANVQKSRAADAVTARFNSGLMRIYSGTRPSTPDTALSGNTLLATLTFSATAFPAASNGSANANSITQESNAPATGTATFTRIFESNGTTVIGDANVGTSGSDINFNSVSIVAGGIVQVTSLTYSQP